MMYLQCDWGQHEESSGVGDLPKNKLQLSIEEKPLSLLKETS